MDLLAHLKDLCAAPGVSGYEGRVREVIANAWRPLAAEVRADRLGSLWAIRPGHGPAPRPRIMLAAHMDAIGLMVTMLEGEFLRVVGVGGIDARVMPGQPVTVHGRRDLPGLVVQPADFLLPKAYRDGVVPVGELLVDCGLPAAQLAELVRVGDVISFAQPPLELQNGLLAANRLDNRASVAAATVCLDELQTRPHLWDVVAVATVQEETRLLGAITSAFELQPQLAIAIDVTWGNGPGAREYADKVFDLGKGPTLGFGPNIHPKLHAALKAVADRLELSYSLEPMAAHSGTDAFGMQVARAGLPTAVIGLPLRNMHTPVEVISVKDVQRAGRLLAEFIAGLDAKFMDSLQLD
jgi:endoglucanase